MDDIKYNYWKIDGHCSTGNADLRDCLGKVVDTNGFTILVCTSGWTLSTINFKKHLIRQGSIVVLPYDMVFIPLKCSANFNLRYVSVSQEMADEVFYSTTLLSFWDLIYEYPCLSCDEEQQDMVMKWFKTTEWIIGRYTDEPHRELLRNHFCNLFTSIYYEIKHLEKVGANTIETNKRTSLISQFYTLLSRYYAQYHSVKFYADKLNITPDYLHKLFVETNNIAPKEVIEAQLITAIKIYLSNTDLSVKNIAAELNFNDPSYMCRFFRRRAGISPLMYRNNNSER